MVARSALVIAVAFIGATAPVLATEPGKKCGITTLELVDCLNAKAAQWDKRLNAAYQTALKDAEPNQRKQLRIAQRLWVKYRDANCLYYDLGEGTIARINAADCMYRMTKERAQELENTGN